MNSFQLVGSVRRQPKDVSAKTVILTLSATRHRWDPQVKEMVAEEVPMEVVCFGRAKDSASRLEIGDIVSVVGNLDSKEWTSQNSSGYNAQLIAETITLIRAEDHSLSHSGSDKDWSYKSEGADDDIPF